MARKIFSTTLDEDIQREFKIACVRKGKNMNDVMEEMMDRYVKDLDDDK